MIDAANVDARLLKAVAIEHSKDPDGAIEFILTEVIPHTMQKFDASSAIKKTLSVASSVDSERQCSSASATSSKHELTAACEGAIGTEVMKTSHYIEPFCLNERVQDPLDLTFYDANDFSDQMIGNVGSKDFTSKTWEKTHQEISIFPITKDVDDSDGSHDCKSINFGETSKLQKYRDLDISTLALSASSATSIPKDAVSVVGLNNKSSDNCDSDFDLISSDPNVAAHPESQKKQPSCDSDSMYGSNNVELALLSVKDHTVESLNCCSIQSYVESLTSDFKLGFSEHSCNDDTAFREDIQVLDNANPDKSSHVHIIVTQSGQVCKTDLLENMIEESKGHKKSLLSDMESVLKLMKDVEIQENAAEKSKKEAGKSGLEIRAKVDELKSMLNHAREANYMHSGEVHEERAILTTEMKELESRLLSLSDVKEKSLSILDVIQKALQTRMAAAEMERNAAEHSKYEREESDRKYLVEQELIMEKVVEESKVLQQEAEENARLREFLMDHGRHTSLAQFIYSHLKVEYNRECTYPKHSLTNFTTHCRGEISVICQDVKLLKEKFDNRVPLSQSVSSEQTSCILASSGSARKSTGSEQLLKHDQSSILSVKPLLLPSVEQKTAFTQNDELLDEGWELFEDA
ncbi:hypothetical protein V2J09_016776 [Rumex salicifolius]